MGEASEEHADSTVQAVEAAQQATVEEQDKLAQASPDASPISSSGSEVVQATDQHFSPDFRESPVTATISGGEKAIKAMADSSPPPHPTPPPPPQSNPSWHATTAHEAHFQVVFRCTFGGYLLGSRSLFLS